MGLHWGIHPHKGPSHSTDTIQYELRLRRMTCLRFRIQELGRTVGNISKVRVRCGRFVRYKVGAMGRKKGRGIEMERATQVMENLMGISSGRPVDACSTRLWKREGQ